MVVSQRSMGKKVAIRPPAFKLRKGVTYVNDATGMATLTPAEFVALLAATVVAK